MQARALVIVCAVAAASAGLAVGTVASDGYASVSIAITWEGLLRESTSAAIVTPIETHAIWEDGRIYSYCRVRVDRAVAGELAAGSEAWVRTLGGIVGKIGQIVEGEAVFAPGQPSLLFLRAGANGSLEVTARGQGQFPVVRDSANAPARVVRSGFAGALLPPRTVVSSATTRLAADVLHGRSVDDVASDVAANWGPMHARP
jgi:hypothetical protein